MAVPIGTPAPPSNVPDRPVIGTGVGVQSPGLAAAEAPLTKDQVTQNYAFLDGTAIPDVEKLKSGTGMSNLFAQMQLQNNDFQNAMTLYTQMGQSGRLTQDDRMKLLRNMQNNKSQAVAAGGLTRIFSQRYQDKLTGDAVGAATARNSDDNPCNAGIRSEYGNDYRRARGEQSNALALARNYGSGVHQVGDDSVEVKYQNQQDGSRHVQVITTHKDGSRTSVQVEPDKVMVDDFDRNGTKTASLGQSGDYVATSDGHGHIKEFWLNDKGEPAMATDDANAKHLAHDSSFRAGVTVAKRDGSTFYGIEDGPR